MLQLNFALAPNHPNASGLTGAPCRKRPDGEGACRLLREIKSNRVCENCGLIPGRGHRVWTNAQIDREIARGLLDILTPEKKKPKRGKKATCLCAFPGCPKDARCMGYCRKHYPLVRARRFTYYDGGGKDPVPITVLHRPVDRVMSKRASKKTLDRDLNMV